MYFCLFFAFWWFCFVSLYFCSCFCLIFPKRLFFCSFRVFFFVVPPKGLSLRSLFSSYSVFFLVFLLFSLSKFRISSLVFVHQPLFLENISFLGLLLSFFFCCLFLCLCLLVSLKQTFLTSPFWNPSYSFWNPSCFHFRRFYSSIVFVLFYFHLFLPLCFMVAFVWYVFLSCFVFVVLLVLLLVLLSDYEHNVVFLAILVFWVMLVTR